MYSAPETSLVKIYYFIAVISMILAGLILGSSTTIMRFTNLYYKVEVDEFLIIHFITSGM